MPQALPPGPRLLRPASVDYFYANNEEYGTAVKSYSVWLKQPPTTTADTTTFEIDATQVRLIYLRSASVPEKPMHTIVYWEVNGKEHSDISKLYKKLLDSGYKGVRPPKSEAVEVDNKKTERCIVASSTGDEFGLVINPPYPRYSGDYDKWQPFFPPSPPPSQKNDIGGGSLLLGLLIGAAIVGLTTWWRDFENRKNNSTPLIV